MKTLIKKAIHAFGYELQPEFTIDGMQQLAERVAGMTSPDELQLLYELAGQVEEGCIVEVGSFRGRSTVALAAGAAAGANPTVYAIEPHAPFEGVLGGQFGAEDRGEFYRTMLASGHFRNVRLVNLSSEQVAPGWQEPIGLLWIDGDHSYEGVQRDFAAWRPFLHPAAPVAFDDSLNPDIGPSRLIEQLREEGEFETAQVVGKVTVLRRMLDPSPLLEAGSPIR